MWAAFVAASLILAACGGDDDATEEAPLPPGNAGEDNLTQLVIGNQRISTANTVPDATS